MAETLDIEQIATRLGLPFQAEIDDSKVDGSLVNRVPLNFARNNLLLPLREEEDTVIAASADPANLLAVDEMAGLFQLPVSIVVVPQPVLLDAVNRLYSRLSGSAQEVVEELEGEELSTLATSFN